MRRIPKRIMYVLIIVLVWLSFIIQGSRALLNDQASLTDNTITSATLDLVINTSQAPEPSSFASSQRGFTYTLLPGQTETKYFWLKNQSDGSVGMDIAAMASIKGTYPPGALENIMIEFALTDSSGIPKSEIVSGSLAELSDMYLRLNTDIVPGSIRRYIVRTHMTEAFALANQSISYDLQFVGTQML